MISIINKMLNLKLNNDITIIKRTNISIGNAKSIIKQKMISSAESFLDNEKYKQDYAEAIKSQSLEKHSTINDNIEMIKYGKENIDNDVWDITILKNELYNYVFVYRNMELAKQDIKDAIINKKTLKIQNPEDFVNAIQNEITERTKFYLEIEKLKKKKYMNYKLNYANSFEVGDDECNDDLILKK